LNIDKLFALTTNTSSAPHNIPRGVILDMWKPSLFFAAALVAPSYALHFFIDGAATKCFFEELPKDTLVQGTFSLSPDPSIYAESWGIIGA
jgi:hypothetical protein